MDVNPLASRDPRLSSRPNQSSATRITSAPELLPPGPLVPAFQTPSSQQNGDNFMRGLSDLIQAAVGASHSRSEKERLRKQRDHTDELLRKALRTNFPSTAEFFQQIKNDEDVDMARIDEGIKQCESNYRRLENELKNRWTASLGTQEPKSDEKVKRLEFDMRDTKERIANTERLTNQNNLLGQDVKRLEESLDKKFETFRETRDQDTRTSRDALEKESKLIRNSLEKEIKLIRGTLDKEVKTIHGTLAAHKKGFASYTNSLSMQANNIEANANQIDQLKKNTRSTSSEDLEALSTQYQHMGNEFRQKAAEWDSKIDALWKSHQESLSALSANITQTPNEQQPDRLSKPQGAVDSKAESAQLTLLETKFEKRFDGLQNVLSVKDDLQFAEMEDVQKTMKALKEDYVRVVGDVNNLKQMDPGAAMEPRLTNLSIMVQQTQQRVETLAIAFHSLESRYNLLNTDHIMQHMIGAIQEMYPSLDQMVAALNRQKQIIEGEIPSLRAKMERIEGQLKQAILSQDDLNTLKVDKNNLSQSLEGLWQKHNSQTEWLNPEDFGKMQSNFSSLAGKFDAVERELELRKSTHETILGDVHQERASLRDEFSKFNDAVQTLSAEFAEMKSDGTNADAILSLKQRIESLEQTISNSHKELQEQFDKLRKATAPRAPSPMNGSATLVDRSQPSTTEGTPSSDHPPLNKKKKKRGLPTDSDDDRSPPMFARGEPSIGPKRHKRKKKKIRNREEEPNVVD